MDIYGKYGNCCRIGGDELCVILNQHFDEVEALNEKFHQAIASLCQEAPWMTTVALGYAFYNHDVLHIQNVIEEADQMMYLNKNSEKFSHYEKRYVFSLFLLE